MGSRDKAELTIPFGLCCVLSLPQKAARPLSEWREKVERRELVVVERAIKLLAHYSVHTVLGENRSELTI